eukprot:1319724-Pleurochrysis_carterae.AAC.1
MNDVERVNEFSHRLPLEAYDQGAEPNAEWPSDPTITFESVCMKYPTASAPVFNSLTFSVPAFTRCGVVGRTGAGKSSLAVALFRVVELSSGKIVIGGVDHACVPLQTLRSRMSIIQQEPTLFRGTLRYNLMPVESGEPLADELLWAALRRAGLEVKVRAMPLGLDHVLSEGGGNLSAGERQLVCMTRALLKRASILLMDEATASVDHETDARIQDMLRSDFCGNTTILTVAHRLHTVMFYERVLVLGAGAVLEHDAPHALLTKQNGVLRGLAEESGDYEVLLASAMEATANP